jgi:hypothetical protein
MVRKRAVERRLRGVRVARADVFHDREGFTTLWSIKSFAIMKTQGNSASGAELTALHAALLTLHSQEQYPVLGGCG